MVCDGAFLVPSQPAALPLHSRTHDWPGLLLSTSSPGARGAHESTGGDRQRRRLCVQRPLTHEEIRSIIHQPVDGYFSNEEDDMLSAANQTPYYYHHGVNVEWSRWDVTSHAPNR